MVSSLVGLQVVHVSSYRCISAGLYCVEPQSHLTDRARGDVCGLCDLVHLGAAYPSLVHYCGFSSAKPRALLSRLRRPMDFLRMPWTRALLVELSA